MIKKSVPENGNYSGFLILSACLLLLLSFGYRSSFGLFVKPITEANGWGRGVISMALALQNLFWGIFAVFAGGMADRFGNLKVIVVGTLLYAFGMLLMSGVDNPWMLNASTGLLVGAGVAGTSFGIILPAMARAVGEERRQWALGLGTAAGSIGQFVMVPVAQVLIEALGWITALNVLAGTSLTMALLYGIVFLGHQIGSFIGVWLGGWLYDTSGSYTAVWWLSVLLGIMAAIVHWPIQERPVGRLAAYG